MVDNIIESNEHWSGIGQVHLCAIFSRSGAQIFGSIEGDPFHQGLEQFIPGMNKFGFKRAVDGRDLGIIQGGILYKDSLPED